jgi:tetratricopeptide (TPR) repeat protein
MLPKTTPKLTSTELLHLIEEARNAELCRDTESLQKILQTVWEIEETPNFDNYEESIKAELLRLCGVFLSFYGNAQNLKNYQIKGKNFLTNAAEIFEANHLLDKAAEAKVMLALCYWNEGEVNECEAILNSVGEEFGKNLLHPVYLQICVNRLLIYFWNQDFKLALKTIEEISSPMRFCTDVRLQAMFHNQAGIFYTNVAGYDKAVFHLNEAIRFAEKAKNKLFVAINLNNLAFLYKDIKDYNGAFKYISESVDKFKQLDHQGLLSHALDTKALIYLDWNKFEDALETIDQSIDCFRQGEDYRGLTDALWTKVRCLLRLDRSDEAFVTFAELEQIAGERIGEVAVKKFAKNLSEEIYVLRGLPLADELTEFKKSRVIRALVGADGSVVGAASVLGLNSHQALSDILNKQFPGLVEKLGFKRRARRGSKSAKNELADARTFVLDESSIHQEQEISRLVLRDKNFSFDFHFSSEKFETFYFDKYLMRKFGIECGAIVAVIPVEEFRAGQTVLVSNEEIFVVAQVEHDNWAKIYFISDENGLPVPLDETNVIGEPVGYCLMAAADKKFIEFSRLG